MKGILLLFFIYFIFLSVESSILIDFPLSSISSSKSQKFATRDQIILNIGELYSSDLSLNATSQDFFVAIPSDQRKITFTLEISLGNVTATFDRTPGSLLKKVNLEPGQYNFTATDSCASIIYTLRLQLGQSNPNVSYTLIATAESNSIEIGSHISIASMHDMFFQNDAYQLIYPDSCPNISILIIAPNLNINSISLRDCKKGKRACSISQSYPTFKQFTKTIVGNIMGIDLDPAIYGCIESGTYLTVSSTAGPDLSPYTLKVAHTKLCGHDCFSNGICFAGQCICDYGFSGLLCEKQDGLPMLLLNTSLSIPVSGDQYFWIYTNLTESHLIGRNVIYDFSGVETVVFYKNLFSYKNMMTSVAYGPTKEICSAAAVGITILYCYAHFEGSGFFNISYYLVDRTLKLNGNALNFTTGTDSLTDHIYFRVPYSSDTSYITAYGSTIEDIRVYDSNQCTYEMFYSRNKDLSYSQSVDYGIGKGVYMVEAKKQCTSNSTGDLYVLVTAFAGKSSIQSFDSLRICRSDIECNNNGFCIKGACECVNGFTGNDCSETFNDTQIMLNKPYWISFSEVSQQIRLTYYNSDFPFLVIYNQTGIDVAVMNPSGKDASFGETAACMNETSFRGWYVIRIINFNLQPVEFSIKIEMMNLSVTYNEVVASESSSASLQHIQSYKKFEVLDSEEVEIRVVILPQTPSVHSVGVVIRNCNGAEYYPSSDGVNFNFTIGSCNGGTYYLDMESYVSSKSVLYTYSIQKKDATSTMCPNCCSKNGICHKGICTQCTEGFGGYDCSAPQCIWFPNFCGITHPFTVNPSIVSKLYPYAGCNITQIAKTIDYQLRQTFPSSLTYCQNLLKMVNCEVYFTSCINGKISKGCIEHCSQYESECPCSDPAGTCNQLVWSYMQGYNNFNNTYPQCSIPLIGQYGLTTQPLSTSPIEIIGDIASGASNAPLGIIISVAVVLLLASILIVTYFVLKYLKKKRSLKVRRKPSQEEVELNSPGAWDYEQSRRNSSASQNPWDYELSRRSSVASHSEAERKNSIVSLDQSRRGSIA